MREIFRTLDNKIPVINDEETRATYLLELPVGGHQGVIFNKLNGKWFMVGFN